MPLFFFTLPFLLFSIIGYSQNTISVKGKITNESGQPIQGASIIVKGSSIGVSSNDNGEFEINALSSATLVISSVAFTTREVKVNGRKILNITLSHLEEGLGEVVVIGYGTQKKSDVTGSIAQVPKERLENLPVANVLQALEGSVAGVNISSVSSSPGSSPTIYIRGLNSISASTTPLFIVDGIPFSGGLNDINPNDIESISILKDASATAIYGTRGSNGVILISTKRGKIGKAVIGYNGYIGPQMQVNVLKPYGAEGYAQKNIDFGTQTRLTNPAPYYNFGEKANYDNNTSVDWLDVISQPGMVKYNELNISGGNESIKYYVSGNYLQQKGVLKGYKFDRLGIRSNLDIKITKWLKIGTNLAFTNENSDGGRVNFYRSTQMSPYGSVYNDDGTISIYPMEPEQLYNSPLLGLNRPTQRRLNNLNGNVYAEVSPSFIQGLKYRINAGYGYIPSIDRSYSGRNTGDLLGSASISDAESKNWIIENILSYAKSFDKHHIDATALYSAQENSEFNNGISANTFINDELAFYNVGAGQIQQVSSSFTRSSIVSQMLRLNYNYDQRYLLTLTARRDGASVFGSANKYATFPSVALGWNISNEEFMKDVKAINSLKFRLSYGITGNQAVSPYRTLTTLGTIQYVYNGGTAVGVIPARLGNNGLKWEKTEGYNAGLDFSFFKNRINGTFDFYRSKTSDLLLNRQLPTVTGYTSILDNVGSTSNKGIEVTLNTINIRKKDFTWESGINFSANSNKVIDLYGDKKSDIGNKWFIGKPLEAVYDYLQEGIYQQDDDIAHSAQPTAKPGDIKFVDINGDGKINSDDKMYLGTGLPKYIIGLTNTFTYKNISLTVFLNTVQGTLRSNGLLDNWTVAGRTNLLAALGYWTEENKSNSRPSLSYLNSYQYLYPRNNSYIRIQDVRINYKFTTTLLDRLKLNNLSVYLSGRNLYTFTKWVGFDPETDPENGIGGTNIPNADRSGYPNIATYVFGINLGF